jgi:CRP/FNR family transcriptional regulator, polysaccharide utilization system transcription regulator
MKKICVIEDNNDVRENLCEILELSGYDVVQAKNGKVGLRVIYENNPDLILCDVMMPELDGFGVLKILCSNPKFNAVPFIFLTAKADKNDLRKGMTLGADDYITKPFDSAELIEVIENKIRKREWILNNTESDQINGLYFNEQKALNLMEELFEKAERRIFKKRESIVEVGQTPIHVFKVVSGKVKSTMSNDMGKELILNVFTEGDYPGILPAISKSRYQTSLYAFEEVELAVVGIKHFDELFAKNIYLSSYFLKYVVQKCQKLKTFAIDLAYSSVRKKLANTLLELYEYNNKNTRIHIFRDDLASMTGSAKETVIRALSDFRNEGIVEVDDQIIVIKNLSKLIDMPQ